MLSSLCRASPGGSKGSPFGLLRKWWLNKGIPTNLLRPNTRSKASCEELRQGRAQGALSGADTGVT